MPVNKIHLPRWIMASVADHFDSYRAGHHLFVEPQIPRMTSEHAKYFELRMDGPHLTNVSGNDWKVKGDINVLCTVQQQQDTYDIYRLSGLMQAAMIDIPLYRYGPDDPTPDDQTYIGCWEVQFSRREDVKGAMMGRIETNTPLVQYLVTGIYETTLKNLV